MAPKRKRSTKKGKAAESAEESVPDLEEAVEAPAETKKVKVAEEAPKEAEVLGPGL